MALFSGISRQSSVGEVRIRRSCVAERPLRGFGLVGELVARFGFVDDRKTGGALNARAPAFGFLAVPELIACGEPVMSVGALPGPSIFSLPLEASVDDSAVSADGSVSTCSTSVSSRLFLPSFERIFLRAFRISPEDEDELELVLDELVESSRCKTPGCVLSSIMCCGVPWYRYECDLN